jgi:predicted RNA-binding protein associated with RNAse of E/G family
VKSRWHVLYIEPHDSMHGVWLFWDEDWNVTNWFVNLQEPYERTKSGIRVNDWYLDLQIKPDLSWSWKDEDEFAELCRLGAIAKDKERAIRRDGAKMARQIEEVAWPFSGGWPDWRPEPAWPVPQIADHWERGGYPFSLG